MKDLKKIANKNNKLKELYTEVSDWKPIGSKKSVDQYWGASIDSDGNAFIEYAKAKNELAALAHELLHLKIQKDGYKRILCSTTTHPDRHFIKTLCNVLDNELQHHKMFPLYCAMGFLPEHFYNENASEVKLHLDQALLVSDRSVSSLIIPYFTLIAPSGCLKPDEISSYKKKFVKNHGRSDPFDTIDTIICEWIKVGAYNAEDAICKIFELIETPAKTWIGYDDGAGFPASGFFVNESFNLDEVQEGI